MRAFSVLIVLLRASMLLRIRIASPSFPNRSRLVSPFLNRCFSLPGIIHPGGRLVPWMRNHLFDASLALLYHIFLNSSDFFSPNFLANLCTADSEIPRCSASSMFFFDGEVVLKPLFLFWCEYYLFSLSHTSIGSSSHVRFSKLGSSSLRKINSPPLKFQTPTLVLLTGLLV